MFTNNNKGMLKITNFYKYQTLLSANQGPKYYVLLKAVVSREVRLIIPSEIKEMIITHDQVLKTLDGFYSHHYYLQTKDPFSIINLPRRAIFLSHSREINFHRQKIRITLEMIKK